MWQVHSVGEEREDTREHGQTKHEAIRFQFSPHCLATFTATETPLLEGCCNAGRSRVPILSAGPRLMCGHARTGS